MPERTNEDIIRIVRKWQDAGFVHELTCRVDSLHAALVPIEKDGKVALECPTCGATQEEIPAVVLGSEPVIDYTMAAERRRRRAIGLRNARGDVWWAVLVAMTCMSVLPGLLGGLAPAVVGGLIGAAMSFAYARRRFRALDALASEPDTRP